jgi:hypothetical protein
MVFSQKAHFLTVRLPAVTQLPYDVLYEAFTHNGSFHYF